MINFMTPVKCNTLAYLPYCSNYYVMMGETAYDETVLTYSLVGILLQLQIEPLSKHTGAIGMIRRTSGISPDSVGSPLTGANRDTRLGCLSDYS